MSPMSSFVLSGRLSALLRSLVAAAALVPAMGCPGVDDTGGSPGEGEGEGEGEGVALEALLDVAASSLCDALFRCCPSDDELQRFFLSVTSSGPNGIYADLLSQVPPNATLTAEQCPALVAQIHAREGLGPFASAAADDLLTYDPAAADACAQTLDDAACGDEVIAALFDGTCFGLDPPAGGDEQRAMFSRFHTEGACRSLADGFGGLYYGTCDPTRAFCCVDQGDGQCGFPADNASGTCVPVVSENEPCSNFNPVLLCATGFECIQGVSPEGGEACTAPLTTSLPVDAPCYDPDRFLLLGDCTDGWCDIFGSNACEPRRPDGEECQAPDQCVALGCVDGICGEDPFCRL